jgi:hypothetical protein
MSMIASPTWPISRVSCWRRKLWRTFEVQHPKCAKWTSTRDLGEGNFKGEG